MAGPLHDPDPTRGATCRKAAPRRRSRPPDCTSACRHDPRTCCAPATACATTCASTAPTRLVIDDVVLCIEEAGHQRHPSQRRRPTPSSSRCTSRAADLVAAVKDHGRGFDVATLRPRGAARPAGRPRPRPVHHRHAHGRARAARRRRPRGAHARAVPTPRCEPAAAGERPRRAARRRAARPSRGSHAGHARRDRRGLLRPRLGVPLRATPTEPALRMHAQVARRAARPHALGALSRSSPRRPLDQALPRRHGARPAHRSSSTARSSPTTGSRCASTRPTPASAPTTATSTERKLRRARARAS